MNFRARSSAGALLSAFLLATAFPGTAGAAIFGKKKEKKVDDYLMGRKLTPAQNALIDKAIVREKEIVKVVKERAPLVETYIQNMRPDPELLQVPESDQHFLARVDFGKVINDELYKPNKGNFAAKKSKFDFFKNSLGALGSISSSLHLTFHEAGFVQMILMDSNDFDRQHYNFSYVRNDFLGNIPTAVFDVTPSSGKKEFGRFYGRIWVETRDGNVVRFNGDFAGTIETIKEHQESQLINSPEYGLLSQVTAAQTISTLSGPPTPDDLDGLIAKVWKSPGFFLTHPLGVAAFGREATLRGVPPQTVSLFGSQFLTWRGIPIIPSDKVPLTDGATKFLLIRTGEDRQGVVGLFRPGLVGEHAPGLSVRFAGINRLAIAQYLVVLYSSLAVLVDDALAVLDDVRVDIFHDYSK